MRTNPGLMSSKVWAPTYSASGVFDNDRNNNPDWHDATFVYMPYCSSDSFSGDLAASPQTFGWHFRGKKILTGVVQAAIGAGLNTAHNVLLSGCSAGGASVVANADFVGSLLPPLANRNFRATSDAGWFLDAVPLAGTLTMATFFQKGQPLWGGIPNENCVKAYGPAQAWRCYMTEYAGRFITTPHLSHQETEDFVQLAVAGVPDVKTPERQHYLNVWRTNVTAAMQKTPSPSATYGPACWWHCSSESAHFWTIRINNQVGYMHALYSFWRGQVANWIDGCPGYNCTPGCPKPPANATRVDDLLTAVVSGRGF